MKNTQNKRMREAKGFIAALDQSGGSTPKALLAYGVAEDQYSNDDEMFAKVHEMRTRIITSPSFTSEKILGAILFEDTMNRKIEGRYSADYLWNQKGIIPFLKVDKGLEALDDKGVQMMKPMPDLDALLDQANVKHIFGTKMRSVVKRANEAGVKAIVAQQFDLGKQILAKGLMPIIEPEVDIHIPDKVEAEALLKAAILEELKQLPKDQEIMLKLTIPSVANFYQELIDHPQVMRVVALSGGYSTEHANALLSENKGLIASFSRALAQDLRASQSEEQFNAALGEVVEAIYEASVKKK